MIPKKIHQIWLGPFDPTWEWISTWKDGFCNKYKWEYKLWRDSDIEGLNLKNKKEYDKAVSYQGKSDIARYEILYRYGGLYLDCDIIWLGKDISEYIPFSTEDFIGFQEPPSQSLLTIGSPYLANGIFACNNGHVILKRVIDSIPERMKINTQHYFIKTGPAAFNRCIKEYIGFVPWQLWTPNDFHYASEDDPMLFKDKALMYTKNGNQYKHIKKLKELEKKQVFTNKWFSQVFKF